MRSNIGNADRVVRLLLGLVLVVLAFVPGVLPGGWNWGSGLVGLVLIATAQLRFCPVYRLLGISTCRLP